MDGERGVNRLSPKSGLRSGFAQKKSTRKLTFLGAISWWARWIRTTEAESSRFTVCPHWPLGNTPIFTFCVLRRTTCLFYHAERLLSTVFLPFSSNAFSVQRNGRKSPAAMQHGKVGEKSQPEELIGKLQEKLGTICEKCKTFFVSALKNAGRRDILKAQQSATKWMALLSLCGKSGGISRKRKA